jgi:hypothetical protein
VAVQVHLVGPVTELLSLLEFVDDALVTSRGDESWEPVRALPALAEPADDRRRAKVNIYKTLSEHHDSLSLRNSPSERTSPIGRVLFAPTSRVPLSPYQTDVQHDLARRKGAIYDRRGRCCDGRRRLIWINESDLIPLANAGKRTIVQVMMSAKL